MLEKTLASQLTTVSLDICYSYNTGTRALPDIYARRPRACNMLHFQHSKNLPKNGVIYLAALYSNG